MWERVTWTRWQEVLGFWVYSIFKGMWNRFSDRLDIGYKEEEK